MLKLMKFLKPFLTLILIAVVLLFIQAYADLSLPDYMADIVNVGIQQNGVDSAIPEVMTSEDMENILLVSNESERSLISSSYDIIDNNDERYEKISKYYKNITNEEIYVLSDQDKDADNILEPIIAKKVLAISGLEKALAGELPAGTTMGEFTFPEGVDLTTFLSMITPEQSLMMVTMINEQFVSLGDKMVIQAASTSLQKDYEELGLDLEVLQRNYILVAGAWMLLFTLLGATCTIGVGYLAAKIAAGLGKNLRSMIFAKVSSFSNSEIDKFSTASLITRSTNDVTQIQNLMVMLIRMIFYAPIIGIWAVFHALEKSQSMAWVIALSVIIMLGLILLMFAIAMPKFKLVQKLIDKINLVTRENLTGMMVIRAFNTQKFEEKRFDNANKELTKTSLFVNRVMVFMMPAMMIVMNGITLLIVWVGAHQIAESTMLVGDMMAFMQYALQIIMAFLMMAMMFIMVPRASVSAQRISEVLETDLTIKDFEDPKEFSEEINGVVEFKNVSFKFPGAEENMLKNISFIAKPGEMTAIIGATGSGKSTLVNLIPRFYDVTEGEVLVDNINIKEVAQHDLREIIGYVPQKSSLFKGTIESNIKYGDKDAPEENVKQAVYIAQAEEIIEEKEGRYKSPIAQGGGNVSGGQKQRLSIARALVKKPKILIFDDSFSALDFQTDSNLRKAMKEKIGDSTLLIVAQRISTIKNANQIIVLEDGEIVGLGTHKELLRTCDTYREIAYSQLSKEELS